MYQVDVIIISNAKNKALYQQTQDAIKSLYNSESSIQFKSVIIESNAQISYDGHDVITLHPDVPFGYNRYLNLGRKMGQTDYVCLCNNDLLFENNWATRIITAINNDPEILSASPRCNNTLYKEQIDLNKSVIYGYDVGQHMAGWCIFQQRSIYNVIGDLDEQFIFWCADNDYAEVLKLKHIKHALIPASIVNHNPSQTIRDMTLKDRINYTHRQKIKFIKKWKNTPSFK